MPHYFHDVPIPEKIAFGATCGLSHRTEIVETGSGFEHRNNPWAHGRRRYALSTGPRPIAELHELQSFFDARQGRLYGFLLRDWLDHSSAADGGAIAVGDQPLLACDSERRIFRLQKIYGDTPHQTSRLIEKPKADTIRIARNGRLLTASRDYELDAGNGCIRFAAPVPEGDEVRAGFEFYVPVRFDVDRLDIQLVSYETGQIAQVPLIEIRLEEAEA